MYSIKVGSDVIPEQRETIATNDYPMPFSKMVSDYAIDLPFKVEISESHYGMLGGGGTLFEGEHLNLHFLKKTDALIAKSGYEMYYVPVCSSYQCNIGVCKDEPLAPTDFSSMAKFLSLPKVVCISNGAGQVKTGELLLVKEVNHSHKKDKVKSITCWSITEEKEKCLKKSCKASFNVAPEATKVYLRDVIDHCQLPMTVQLYTTGTSTTTLTINKRSLVKSVIASKQNNPDELLEIVASTDMMAQKLETSASDTKELQELTALAYEAFHPSKITLFITSDSETYTQNRTSICTSALDDWKCNIQLVPPTALQLPEMQPPKPIIPPKSDNIYQNTTLQRHRKVCETEGSPHPADTTYFDVQSQNTTTSLDDTPNYELISHGYDSNTNIGQLDDYSYVKASAYFSLTHRESEFLKKLRRCCRLPNCLYSKSTAPNPCLCYSFLPISPLSVCLSVCLSLFFTCNPVLI